MPADLTASMQSRMRSADMSTGFSQNIAFPGKLLRRGSDRNAYRSASRLQWHLPMRPRLAQEASSAWRRFAPPASGPVLQRRRPPPRRGRPPAGRWIARGPCQSVRSQEVLYSACLQRLEIAQHFCGLLHQWIMSFTQDLHTVKARRIAAHLWPRSALSKAMRSSVPMLNLQMDEPRAKARRCAAGTPEPP